MIIPTYNWSAALRCAIRSVLLQTRQDFEILVVGDACTDDTAAVVASFKDRRIHWHNLERNHGSQWAANNFGLMHAAADWVAYLGHDDIWYPAHLEAILRTAVATQADMVTSVMVLYGPPGTGIRGLAGVFGDRVSLDTDFVPPSALAHKTSLTSTIGFWPDPESSILPVDAAYLSEAARASVQVASTNELTVFKFNAAWRRDAYKVKSTLEQHELLERIMTGTDVRHDELVDVLRARAADKLIDIKVPDMSGIDAGELHLAYRRYKGVEQRFAAPNVRQLETAERFSLSDVHAGFEWHLEESDGEFGSFRWSGPALRSSVDLPVQLEGDAAIRIHILHTVDPETVEHLKLECNTQVADCQVEHLPSGTFLVHGVVRKDGMPRDESGVRITLELKSVHRPLDLGINEDRRWLGIAVNWIELEPLPQMPHEPSKACARNGLEHV